jgi:flavodoxin I
VRTLIVYDSVYGNTEAIAKAIGDAVSGEVRVVRVGDVNSSALETFDLLIVGSPTHGGRPTPAIQEFLEKLPLPALKGANVAAFDTRMRPRLARIFGFAAGRIARTLKKRGANVIGSPQGFFVQGSEGPLKEGEVERAAVWAKEMVESTE